MRETPAVVAASAKCVRGLAVALGEVGLVVHRVHEVARGVDVLERPTHVVGRADVALGHLDAVDPRLAVHRGAAPGQHPDRPALVEQPRDDLAADVAGGSGHEGASCGVASVSGRSPGQLEGGWEEQEHPGRPRRRA